MAERSTDKGGRRGSKKEREGPKKESNETHCVLFSAGWGEGKEVDDASESLL